MSVRGLELALSATALLTISLDTVKLTLQVKVHNRIFAKHSDSYYWLLCTHGDFLSRFSPGFRYAFLWGAHLASLDSR